MPKNDSRTYLDQTTTILSVDSEDLAGESQTLGSFPEIIPPRTYHIQHDGWHKGVRIWVLEPPTTSIESSKEPSLVSDSKNDLFNDAESRVPLIQTMPYKASGTSKDKEKERKKKYPVIDPSRVPASYYIKRSKFAKYVMFQGSGPDDECLWAKRLLTIDGEGILSRNSKYTQADGDRSARMYGQDGPDPVISWRHL
ncbi:hypothetical protein FS837_004410 [Tulasnella sp. UAMH 9824]|nr:hypothetical protein FS837_004410 [Tulasnella sp. UAMH 9824]